MWHLTLLDIIAATSHLHKDPMSGLEDNKEQGQMDVNAPDESMPSTKEQVVLKNCFLAFSGKNQLAGMTFTLQFYNT